MGKIFKSIIYWVIAVILVAIVLIMVTNVKHSFQSETRILFIPKNDSTARNIDQTLNNAKEIPLSLSFYNKMLELNPDIEDGAVNLPDDQRKNYWDSKISITNVDKSGIIKINVYDKSQWQAEVISKQVAASLLTVMNRYYDIKTELDMRIIDGPIIRSSANINWTYLIIISAICGLAIVVVNIFLKRDMTQPKFGNQENNPFSLKFPSPSDHSEILMPEEPKQEFTNFEKKYEENVPDLTRKAAAPSNLPISEETSLPVDENPAITFENQPSKPSYHEATPEEVKERLNKLLEGKF